MARREFNPLYFFFFLLILAGLTLAHFASENLSGIPLFFLLYALGQALLETTAIALIAWLLRKWAPRWAFYAFVSSTFLFLLVQFTDLALLQIMDTTIGYLFLYFASGGLAHVGAAFHALNMNLGMICLICAALLLLPALGIFFYSLTDRATPRVPIQITPMQLFFTMLGVGTALLLLDVGMRSNLGYATYSRFQKHLPLGTTFLPPAPPEVPLSSRFFPARPELSELPPLQAPHKPNIFLFVVESFRRDFITPEIAPHLHALGQAHLSFPESTANSNSTHTSWYALLHANTPLRWTQAARSYTQGALPLRLFKQLGYKIHVLCAADFTFFNIDPLLFGNTHQLPDTFLENPPGVAHERDAQMFAEVRRHLTSEGNLFLVFLDGTHSEYSFPEEATVFEPIDPQIDYLALPGNPDKLERVKNRYRNAIHHIDAQFGSLFAYLREQHLWDEAIFAITGDHGEEFFEDGALFHGTHLNTWQTAVPIFLKLPGNPPLSRLEASHIDLFPTILHALTGQNLPLFDGESLLTPARRHPILVVQHNGGAAPTDFLLLKNHQQLHARLRPQEGRVALLSVSDPALLIELPATGDLGQTAD